MDNRRKNLIYSLILLTAVFVVYKWRSRNTTTMEPVRIEGRTMGTTYHITYFDEGRRDFTASIDSLLVLVNRSINTYDPESEVSKFNSNSRGISVDLPFLLPPLKVAADVYEASGGAFDPTVMPLVNAWGFGPGKRVAFDSARIDSIRNFVGFSKLSLSEDSVKKNDPRVQLDFGGIGQGYGADVITGFLQKKGIENMLVELGGEGVALGKNLKTGNAWQIGILDPNSTEERQFFKAYVSLTDKAFTTSGNYFNYHEENGVKYSHTIDPVSGFPARKAILSASVFADDCTTADAWGTAFMVMGHERAMEVLKDHPEIDVLIFFSNPSGDVDYFMTEGIKAQITLEPGK